MPQFAEIVFPTAVRHPFTYGVPDHLRDQLQVGTRVWVPLQKHKSIGMVVAVHDRKPDFSTRPIEKVLDDTPVLSDELLSLTRWIHRFYYCGWGEVIQTALPVGLNFYAEKYLQPGDVSSEDGLGQQEKEILREISENGEYLHDEAQKRWSNGKYKRALNSLIRNETLEVWERPVMKMKPQTEKQWDWHPESTPEEVDRLVQKHLDEGKEYKWIQALNKLRELDLPRLNKELTDHELLEYYTLNRIAEEGLIRAEEVEVTSTIDGLEHDPSKIKKLNKKQQQAFEAIENPLEEGNFSSFLLYGVTGSGKTEVYIHALKKALKQGKGGIVLVPEISLTPQTVRRFYQIFGDTIAVLHSGLTDRERYNAWQDLRNGEKRIAIGARSAIFAPVQEVGLIIVDEEHDASYKQTDPAPRYHGRDVAIMRAYLNDATVVMGSATPSMNVLYNARKGKSTMLTLPSRHKGATLPEVHVVDLKQYRSAMKGPLAVSLFNAVEEALERKEQVILLHNRRGYSSFLQCADCGHIPECPNCSVSLTYHKIQDTLRCHYCGYSQRIPGKCGFCNGSEIKQQGIGTQQVENELEKLFPDASISRMDRDTTSGKGSHERILSSFGDGAIDILVGTQLVAKGLDFPNVTIVGVINADTELAFPSFRSAERMYQLLSQVSGRSGRADKKGEVYLQTWQSDHFAIQCAREHDHRKFARQEMAKRKDLYYPPYSRIVAFQFKSRDSQKVERVAHAFTRCLREIAGQYPVLGPSPAAITRMQGFVRWESMLKLDPQLKTSEIEQLLERTFDYYDQEKPKGTSSVRINVDVDAIE
ncbi:primosomal protein N' [Halalkalibaculum sp. DA3122]|uniref:replication restart helicase PriA n=1 Tax=unclassified Halalkalibaculum TaxID=2964617 RepID=UPI00375472B7